MRSPFYRVRLSKRERNSAPAALSHSRDQCVDFGSHIAIFERIPTPLIFRRPGKYDRAETRRNARRFLPSQIASGKQTTCNGVRTNADGTNWSLPATETLQRPRTLRPGQAHLQLRNAIFHPEVPRVMNVVVLRLQRLVEYQIIVRCIRPESGCRSRKDQSLSG